MTRWFGRSLVVVNFILIVLGVISYVNTINALVYWTHWGETIGEAGGVLDYRTFGESVVYHVTKDNLRGQQLLTFLDVPSYLFAVLIVLNSGALLVGHLSRTMTNRVQIRNFAFRNVVLSILCTLAYAWWTMMGISNTLISYSLIGGTVDYQFPLQIWILNVYEGHTVSTHNWHIPDFTLWLLFALLASTLVMMAKQLKYSQTQP